MLSWALGLVKLVPNYILLIACALAAGVMGYFIGSAIGFNRGESAGYSRFAAEQAVRNHKIETQRKDDDVRIQTQGDFDACVDSLRRRGLPIDSCEQLRGIHAE